MTANLDELVAKLRKVDAIGVEIATDALPEVVQLARATAAAGTDPYGTTWKPTKKGRAPLQNAASAITARVSGLTTAVVSIVLSGFYVFHHPTRSMVPTKAGGVPDPLVQAVHRAAARRLAKVMA